MEFPKPIIDADATERAMLLHVVEHALARAADMSTVGGWRPSAPEIVTELMGRSHYRSLLAAAWEEGRWSPPGACLNPYGAPNDCWADSNPAPQVSQPGRPVQRLRAAAEAALAWVENMAPTVRRTALANQLRGALGLEPKS